MMFCPKCKDEFITGITDCPDCEIPLVKELPAETETAYEPVYVEQVTVLETSDPGIIMVAKSLLEEARIRYYAKNEVSQHLFGGGTFGTGFNPLTGPTQLQVSKNNFEEALALLKDLLE
jgi:hypothetical protein